MMAHVDTAVRFVITALFSGLWQAPVFAFAAWLVLRIRPHLNATTRHSVLAAALFASLALPIVTAAVTANAAPAQMLASGDNARGTGDAIAPNNILPYNPGKRSASEPSRTNPGTETPSTLLAVPTLARLSFSLPRIVALGIVAVWFLGAAFVLLRLVISLSHLERLKRDALPLPVEYRAELTRWAAAAKGSRTVRLCMSEEIEIPIAVGLFDAMILIPTRLLEELAPADVDSIVLHELAHLRRSDDWVNAIERFTQAFLFFNPGILWLNGQLDLEREVACDDWVLQQNDALPYATCLAKVVETTIWPFRAMTAPGAFVTRRGMSIRIERLLSKHRDVRIHTSVGPAGAVVGMLAALGIVAAFVSPSIAYSVSQPGEAAAALPATASTVTVVTVTPAHAQQEQTRSLQDITMRHAREAATSAALSKTERDREARDRAKDAHDRARSHVIVIEDGGPGASSSPGSASASSSGSGASYSYDGHFNRDPHPNVHPGVRPNPHVDVHPDVHAHPQPSNDAAWPTESDVSSDISVTVERAMDEVRAAVPAVPPVPASPASPAASKTAALAPLAPLPKTQFLAEANSPDYIDELASVGYTNLSVDNLIQMKAVGVSASFIRDLQQQGFGHPSVSELVQYRALGIDAGYMGAMRRRFGSSLGLGSIAGMRAVGVTPEYVDALSALGYKNLPADRIQGLRALGVTPGYVGDLSRLGFKNLTIDEIQQCKALDIDRSFIDEAKSHGFHDLTVQQLINLKATGVL